MPPKAKFSKEQITEAGLQIVREKGADSLTARALGEKLGSSSCPYLRYLRIWKKCSNR